MFVFVVVIDVVEVRCFEHPSNCDDNDPITSISRPRGTNARYEEKIFRRSDCLLVVPFSSILMSLIVLLSASAAIVVRREIEMLLSLGLSRY